MVFANIPWTFEFFWSGHLHPLDFTFWIFLILFVYSIHRSCCHMMSLVFSYMHLLCDWHYCSPKLKSTHRDFVRNRGDFALVWKCHELSWLVSILTISELVERICLAAPSSATTCPQTLRSWGIPEPPEPQQTLESAPWQQALDYALYIWNLSKVSLGSYSVSSLWNQGKIQTRQQISALLGAKVPDPTLKDPEEPFELAQSPVSFSEFGFQPVLPTF